MADYPGPFCQEYGIFTTDLNKGVVLCSTKSLKNGLVLEINKFVEEKGHNSSNLYSIITQLDTSFSQTTEKYLKNKVSRTCDQRKTLLSKKKVPGVKNLNDFLNREFKPSVTSLNKSADEINLEKTISQIESISVCDNDTKSQNLSVYEHQKLQKHSVKIEKKIEEQKKTLIEIENRIGHYSLRNVNKRDETAKKNLHMLRDSQRLNRKHEKVLENTKSDLKKCQKEKSAFSAEVVLLNEKIETLNKEIQTLNEHVSAEKRKKIATQKYNSYLRTEMKSLKEKVTEKELDLKKLQQQKSCTECEKSHAALLERENEVLELNDHVNNLTAEKVRMKNEDGSYSNEVRLCIMELCALEVAVEKVSPVIQTISKHLFHVNLEKKDIPSSSTTQSIVDEGHFIAKSYISHKLSETENWGLHRDGTSRKKQKLLDTSVRLSSGETMSLGFNRVAHETADTINNITKEHLSELAGLHSNIKNGESEEDYIKSSLEKLSYTMSDRAANEKKADKLLDEWRTEVLENTDSHEQVHHFHCMAHVLLGFHNYICQTDLKEHESSMAEEHGPLGRDALKSFKFWSKKGTVLERALRTTSEVFGPAGNHYGVRDSWEAHCAENGIKSVIGNYRDNRFNALFQTAAEVFLHREDFITVLQNVKSNNLLVQSVLADLQSEPIMTEVQCLGLFYLQLTGPYWNAVLNNTVPYLQLYKEVQTIHTYLQELEVNPAAIFQEIPLSDIDTLKVPYHNLFQTKLEQISEDNVFRELLFKTIKMASAAMKRTVEKQLSDFLDGGKFAQVHSDKDVQITNFAPVTNLACEHHFGHLDSSQRKRPGASLYHHSSVQLLKQTITPVIGWLSEFPDNDKDKLMKSARQGGKQLRSKHKEKDRSVLSEINNENLLYKTKKQNRKRKAEAKLQNRDKNVKYAGNEDEDSDWDAAQEEARLLEQIPTEEPSENQYVAIAYQDAWYPGVVMDIKSSESFTVKFMAPTNKLGHYKWPLREDRQIVDKQFMISAGFVPDCINSGRMWKIKEAQSIENIFRKYSLIYFKD